MTRRPVFDFWRIKKPCFRALFLFLGWYVFDMEESYNKKPTNSSCLGVLIYNRIYLLNNQQVVNRL